MAQVQQKRKIPLTRQEESRLSQIQLNVKTRESSEMSAESTTVKDVRDCEGESGVEMSSLENSTASTDTPDAKQNGSKIVYNTYTTWKYRYKPTEN